MSDAFVSAASLEYPIVDADAHFYEPSDLWQRRVAAGLRARAPCVVRTGDGDAWLFDDGARVRHVGLIAATGASWLDLKPTGLTYDDVRPAAWDPAARLADMDAYNEWILEFCAAAPARLFAHAVIPATGVADATAELDDVLRRGHHGVLLSTFPSGGVEPSADDEPFWARASEAGMPVALHIGSFHPDGPPARRRFDPGAVLPRAATSKSGANTVPLVTRMLFSGVFERFPRLRVVLAEANIGWIPAMLEQTDDMFLRYRWFTDSVARLPRR